MSNRRAAKQLAVLEKCDVANANNKTLIVGYQIGYRVRGIGGYSEQYTDLPMHRVDDYGRFESIVSAVNALNAAQALVNKLRSDIGGIAEWRIVEVWE